MAPTGARQVQLQYVGDSVVAVRGKGQPKVRVLQGGAEVVNPELSFASADTAILALGPDGELIGVRRGTVYLRYLMSSALFPSRPPLDSVRVRVVADSISIGGELRTLTAIGDSLRLVATAWDAAGEPIPGVSVAWSTEPTDGAVRVSTAGTVRAVAGGGAEVIATVDDLQARAPVTVAQEVAALTFQPTTVLLEAFSAVDTIRAIPLDRNGYPVPDDPAVVTLWTSRDTTVVSMRGGGIITAEERNDSTWVIADRAGIVDSLVARVRQRAKTVEIQADPGALTTDSGFVIPALYDLLHLRGVARDSLGWEVTNARVSWEIANQSILQRTDSLGTVQGIAVGATTVTAALHGVVGRVWVDVRNDPAAVQITGGADTLRSVPDTVQFTATALNSLGEPIADATFSWSVSNALVATVDAAGRVTGEREGETLVIAAAGEVADSVRLVVRNYPDTVDITVAADSLLWIGDSTVVPVRVRNAAGAPANAAYLTWEARDLGVASVSGSVVYGVGVGTTWVLATFYEGGVPHRRDSLQIQVTNDPVSVVASAETDSLTLPGQQLRYTAVARNGGGAILPDSVVVWRSTAPAIASIDSDGLVTANGYGTALIIADAAPVADTVVLTVLNPTLVFVDNSVIVAERFGTLKRPFARIQDGVAAADAFDTVFVRRGFGYSEAVALSRRITLIGDSSAFVAGGRDPTLLPRLAHDSGTAGIRAHTTASVQIGYLAIVHSLDGPAIDARGGDVQIAHVHVNPASDGFRVGQGIRLAHNPVSAVIRDVRIASVRGYGIRLDTTSQVQVTAVVVDGVDSLSSLGGEGIQLVGGDRPLITRTTVRRTRGAQIAIDGTVGATVTSSDLAGRSRLILIRNAATDVTRLEGNVLDLTRDPASTDVRGSADDGRAGIEIHAARAQLRDNVFIERGTSVMDAVRLVDARGGAEYGAVELTGPRFSGGRSAVRSERSSWTMRGARSDSAITPIVLLASDSVRLVDDTLANARQSTCIEATAASAVLVITGGAYENCGTDGTSGGRSVRMTGSTSRLTVAAAAFRGPNQTAIEFTGTAIDVRRSVLSGAGTRSVSSFVATAAIEVNAADAIFIGNAVSGYSGLTGISMDATTIRADSNRLWMNRIGLRFGNWFFLTVRDNDLSDHELAGMMNAVNRNADVPGNWWGDGRGPRRDAEPAATGDSAIGSIVFDPPRTTPREAGATGVLLRKVRGDGQSGPTGTVLPKALTARVVDPESRPVAGVLVTFQLSGGSGGFEPTGAKTVTVTSDASGLAEAVLRLSKGTNTVTVSAPAPVANTLTFTATGQ